MHDVLIENMSKNINFFSMRNFSCWHSQISVIWKDPEKRFQIKLYHGLSKAHTKAKSGNSTTQYAGAH